jgi:hypothetical protein
MNQQKCGDHWSPVLEKWGNVRGEDRAGAEGCKQDPYRRCVWFRGPEKPLSLGMGKLEPQRGRGLAKVTQ